MNIIILNGSPKGEDSITLQYLKFLERKFDEHKFQIIHVSQKIKKIEKDKEYFNDIIQEIDESDALIWSFGLWVLAVPAQYMRFIELISERNVESVFQDKYTAAISTSIRFYDHTAHNYIRGVCEDLNMRFVDGISFYILDLMKEEKREDLQVFFENLVRTHNQQQHTSRLFAPIETNGFAYRPGKTENKISTNMKILVITDQEEKKSNLYQMINRFTDSFQNKPEIIELDRVHIQGACLGCMRCGYDYNCQYKDGFKDFYNNHVRKADILVFAGTMKGRYLSSLWKTFFDRAYFWNHTPSLVRKQIAYLISGPISKNPNLVQILEGNVATRQSANLVDIVTDESADSEIIDSLLDRLAQQVVHYAEIDFVRPKNFMGVGGHKIFRDEIFGHIRGVWQADHRYYRKHGYYDFEQKKIGLRIMNTILLLACKIPSVRKKYYGNIKKFPAKRFGKLIDKLVPESAV